MVFMHKISCCSDAKIIESLMELRLKQDSLRLYFIFNVMRGLFGISRAKVLLENLVINITCEINNHNLLSRSLRSTARKFCMRLNLNLVSRLFKSNAP